MTEGKGIGYKRWLTKHNLKVMAQTVKLLQEKGLTDEGALNQRIAELETKYHESLTVVKDLEGRMKANKELCHNFEIVFREPTLIANALALGHPRLDVDQFPDGILL